MLRRLCFAIVALFDALLLLPAAAHAGGPVVQAVLFHSATCSHCQIVLKEVLPPLQAQYGAQLEIEELEISTPANYETLLQMEAAYNIPADKGVVPEMFIGGRVLAGETEIREQLPGLVAELLRQGGSPSPLQTPAAPTPTPRMIDRPENCSACERKEQTEAAQLAPGTPTPYATPSPAASAVQGLQPSGGLTIGRYLHGLGAFLCLAAAVGSLYDWYRMRRALPRRKEAIRLIAAGLFLLLGAWLAAKL